MVEIDEDEFASLVGQFVAIPEIALAAEPVWLNLGFVNAALRETPQRLREQQEEEPEREAGGHEAGSGREKK